MTKALTILAAAVSIICGSAACASTITADPWYPKRSRSDAAERDRKDAAATPDAADSDAGDDDGGEEY